MGACLGGYLLLTSPHPSHNIFPMSSINDFLIKSAGMEKAAKRWFIKYLEKKPSFVTMGDLLRRVKGTPFESELKEYFTDSKHAKNFKFMAARDAGRQLAKLIGGLHGKRARLELMRQPLFRKILERYTINKPTDVFKHGKGYDAYIYGKGNATMAVGQAGKKFNKNELTDLLYQDEPDAYEFVRTAADEMPKFKDAFIPDTSENRKLLRINWLTALWKSKKLRSLQDTRRNVVYRGGMGGYHHPDSLPVLQDIADPEVTYASSDARPIFFSPSVRVGAQYADGSPSNPNTFVRLNSRWLKVPDNMLESFYKDKKGQLNAESAQQNITALRNTIQKNMPKAYIAGFHDNVQSW